MDKITDLNQINTATKEGQYLMSALALITTALRTNDTPYNVLEELGKHVEKMRDDYINQNIQIQDAIRRLSHELKHDAGYFYAWQSNIAMAFKDEYDTHNRPGEAVDLHQVANAAAKNFLNLLIREPNADTQNNH